MNHRKKKVEKEKEREPDKRLSTSGLEIDREILQLKFQQRSDSVGEIVLSDDEKDKEEDVPLYRARKNLLPQFDYSVTKEMFQKRKDRSQSEVALRIHSK